MVARARFLLTVLDIFIRLCACSLFYFALFSLHGLFCLFFNVCDVFVL